jgi:hypothetical protein
MPGWHQLRLGLCEDYPEESRTLEAARRDLELTKRSGAQVLRIAFGWDAMEPNQGQYDWSFWDEFVPMAVDEFGVTLIPYVCYTPAWASSDPGPDHWRAPPKRTEDFAAFVRALVRRYGKWIKTWELWNEPDNPAYWLGTPAQFADLTKAGSAAVRETDPNATVVLGGLAGELDFLETVFRDEQIAPSVDVVNFHSYLETWHPDPIERISSEIERASDIVESFGENEPLWLAEVGYSSVGPRRKTSDVYYPRFADEHSAEAQADAMVRFVTLAAASKRISTFAWYRINDLPLAQDVIGDDNNRYLGVVTVYGERKPALSAFEWLSQTFAQPYRTVQVHATSRASRNVQLKAFEFRDGRRLVFAWQGRPGSGAEHTRMKKDERRTLVQMYFPELPHASLATLAPISGASRDTTTPRLLKDGRIEIELVGSVVQVFELRQTNSASSAAMAELSHAR